MKREATWIKSPVDTGTAACTFETQFSLDRPVRKAILRASAMGVYVPALNGQWIGTGVLAPGWTCYKDRVQYQTYDVTDMLTAENTLSMGVGQGWAVGYIGHVDTNHFYADHTSVIAWLEITFTDGTWTCITTNEAWQVYTNEVTFSEIYHGETVDKTAPRTHLGHALTDTVSSKLTRQIGEPITEQERLAPVAL